jgi:hypothetical protein
MGEEVHDKDYNARQREGKGENRGTNKYSTVNAHLSKSNFILRVNARLNVGSLSTIEWMM